MARAEAWSHNNCCGVQAKTLAHRIAITERMAAKRARLILRKNSADDSVGFWSERNTSFFKNFIEGRLGKTHDVEFPSLLRLIAIDLHMSTLKADQKVGCGLPVRHADSVPWAKAGIAHENRNIVQPRSP